MYGKMKNVMVAIAQLVEPRIVIPVVEGSSPFSHPIFTLLISLINKILREYVGD